MLQRNERGIVVVKNPNKNAHPMRTPTVFPLVDDDGWTWTEVGDVVEGRPPAAS